MVKFITRTICMALITVLCVGNANAQLVKTKTADPKAAVSVSDLSSVRIVSETTPAPRGMVNVTLAAGDVWGDGTGYQMLLDADHNTFGSTIPATGALYTSCSAPATLYDVFEYKIPTNADPVCTTSNIVFNTSITIQIPAGTYDFCIANPTPGDRIWIANGDNARRDDYVFEDGKKYTFTVTLNQASGNDNVALLVEDDTPPEEPCDPATNLTAVHDETGNQLNWVLPSTKSREVIYTTDFEDLPDGANYTIPGWTLIDADGDGNNWYGLKNAGTPTVIPGHSGTGLLTSASYTSTILYPDNYLISPLVEGATSVSYWVNNQDAGYPEHYGVYASTSGTAVSDFTLVFEETVASKGVRNDLLRGTRDQGQWREKTLDLPAGTKYVAWRHFNSVDNFRINLDDITIYGGTTPPPPPEELTVNIYRDGTLIASDIEGTTYHDDYDPTLAACYTVEVNCADDEVSEMSNEACVDAVTPPPCNPVTDAAVEINAGCTEATITWTPVEGAEMYQVIRSDVSIPAMVGVPPYIETDTYQNGTTYKWTITTICSNGNSEGVEVSKTVECVGISEIENNVSIYPNPATSMVTINAKDFVKVEVYNTVGQLMTTSYEHSFDVSAYNAGIYFFKVYDANNNTVTKRVMVAK